MNKKYFIKTKSASSKGDMLDAFLMSGDDVEILFGGIISCGGKNPELVRGSLVFEADVSKVSLIAQQLSSSVYENVEHDVSDQLLGSPESILCETTLVDCGDSIITDYECEYHVFVKDSNDSPVCNAKVMATGYRGFVFSGLTSASGEVIIKCHLARLSCIRIEPASKYLGAVKYDLIHANNPQVFFGLKKIEENHLNSWLTEIGIKFDDENHRMSGLGVKVAIIDSGVDLHENLPTAVIRKEFFRGSSTTGQALDNGLDHGSHVAGIVAGQGNPQWGIAPGVSLMIYRVLANYSAKVESVDVAAAIDAAVEDGAHVINLSLGFKLPDEAIKDAITSAVSAGVLVVAAVGNDGNDQIRFPARMDSVVAVGAAGIKSTTFSGAKCDGMSVRAVANSGGDYYIPFFSNYGNGNDGSVNVVAPGVEIISTIKSSDFKVCSGTSMAAPVVTALAARIICESQEYKEMEKDKKVDFLKERLYNKCINLGIDQRLMGNGLICSASGGLK